MKKHYISISIIAIIFFSFILYKNFISNNEFKEKKTIQVDGKYNIGKRIYEKYCSSCHDKKMIEYATAPPLGGITKRRNKEWLYSYTRNSYQMYKDGDSIAIKLRSENFGLMTSFPMLNNNKLDAVYYYIEKEYKKNKNTE